MEECCASGIEEFPIVVCVGGHHSISVFSWTLLRAAGARIYPMRGLIRSPDRPQWFNLLKRVNRISQQYQYTDYQFYYGCITM